MSDESSGEEDVQPPVSPQPKTRPQSNMFSSFWTTRTESNLTSHGRSSVGSLKDSVTPSSSKQYVVVVEAVVEIGLDLILSVVSVVRLTVPTVWRN
jgi:hypothetical protein